MPLSLLGSSKGFVLLVLPECGQLYIQLGPIRPVGFRIRLVRFCLSLTGGICFEVALNARPFVITSFPTLGVVALIGFLPSPSVFRWLSRDFLR